MADSCDENGFLYLRGINRNKDKTVIIILKPKQLNHDSLFKVIPTDVLAPADELG